MAKNSRKNISPKAVKVKASKAPGKTHIPASKFRQRRFSIIDSESSSLSDFESEEEDEESPKKSKAFQAIASESEEEDDSDSANEELWRSHSNRVVNTSSSDEDGGDAEDSSSSDDENVDFVKLTAERKAKLQKYRGSSPFKSPSPDTRTLPNIDSGDVDFSFNFSKNDNEIKLGPEEEEDLGEELSGVISPPNNFAPINDEPLAYPAIESSESDDDIDKDELLRTLEQESDGIDTGIDTGDDDYNLLKEEADNIVDEFNADDGSSSFLSVNTATPKPSVAEQVGKSEEDADKTLELASDDEYADDDDDYDDDEELNDDDFFVPYFDDSAFKQKLYTNGSLLSENKEDMDSDDDSYLWDYFFSSGEENEEGEETHNHGLSDDEATDEDTTLPPPSSRKKVGSKAQELLSSSSLIARPPALGTWSTDHKPFGIIDGLSTRSLLPTPTKGTERINPIPVTPVSAAANNIEELTLDELLNMSELEEDDDQAEALNHEQWLEVTGSNRKVPLSAFRNKGIVNDNSHINATRLYANSATGGKKQSKKSRQRVNEITMTPVRVLYKNVKSKKKGSKIRRRQSFAEAAVEGLRVTRSGVFSEDTLNNVEEFLSGLGNEAELSVLFREL